MTKNLGTVSNPIRAHSGGGKLIREITDDGERPMEDKRDTSPVTMATLAKRVGVHVSTVSRALQEPRQDTNNRTTLMIRELADQLDFQPDATASRLRTRRSRLIGVTVPSLTDPVHAITYEGIDKQALSRGYSTMLSMSANLNDRSPSRANNLIRSRVEGIIIQDTFEGDLLPETLRKRHIPHVMCLRKNDDELSVAVDDLLGGRLAAEHLAAAGHTEIAIISPDSSVSTGRDRVEGFRRRMLELGTKIDDSRIVPAGFDIASGQRAAETLLGWPKLPTAIFASNDLTAAGIMFRLREAGISIGRDVALVGYNDIEISKHLPVPLTTIASPLHEVGARSLDTLIEVIEGRVPDSLQLTPRLLARESTLAFVTLNT
ncbi:substrate-binding domain-containing protein [Crystallibacter degradans]|uniref:substrate-binding domain-containing protein n=1 Tax=Crystallibacter degradans TaxID=2726743 RepID=UPI001474916C|nr:substrate-binding domain-containing protein [Arthrobacter sp. SF27]NMR29127.1 substrate-binding domain-containing protein [Arthrobacter sp. SF27]